jgi:hypothetical protein
VFIDADGTAYIALAGNGGETAAETVSGSGTIGGSSAVISITTGGMTTQELTGLFSFAAQTGEANGANTVYLTEESIWVLIGQGPTGDDRPTDLATFALIEFDRATKEVKQTIDLLPHEETVNPDGEGIDSNPSDFAVAADGTIYIADAGANAVLKWTADEGVTTFAAWTKQPDTPSAVPTAVEVDAEGNVYVGFLTGFPFPTGWASVEKLDAAGELLLKYEGLTMVTDLAFGDDGTLYAVEFAQGLGDTGFIPNSGRIVEVTEAGLEVVVDGLNFPYGMAVAAEDTFYVTVNSAFDPEGNGQLVMVFAGQNVAPLVDPSATEEAQ